MSRGKICWRRWTISRKDNAVTAGCNFLEGRASARRGREESRPSAEAGAQGGLSVNPRFTAWLDGVSPCHLHSRRLVVGRRAAEPCKDGGASARRESG